MLPLGVAGGVPLKPGGEASAAAPSQAGDLDLLDDLFGGHVQGLVDGLVAVLLDIIVDAGGVHHAAVAQGHALLLLQEAGVLVADEHGLQLGEVFFPNGFHDAQRVGLGDLHQAVEELLPLVDIDDGLQIAHANTAGGLDGEAVGGGHVTGQDLGHPAGTGRHTAAALSDQDADALAGLALAQLTQDVDGLFGGEVPIGVAVDHHDGGQGAAAKTCHFVQGEHPVLGGLTVVDAQLLGDGRPDAVRAVDVAGRAVAQHDLIDPHGLEAEIAVEGRNTHDLGRAVARALSHMIDHFLGQVAVDGLGLLQDHDEAGGVVLVLAEHTLHQGQIDT